MWKIVRIDNLRRKVTVHDKQTGDVLRVDLPDTHRTHELSEEYIQSMINNYKPSVITKVLQVIAPKLTTLPVPRNYWKVLAAVEAVVILGLILMRLK